MHSILLSPWKWDKVSSGTVESIDFNVRTRSIPVGKGPAKKTWCVFKSLGPAYRTACFNWPARGPAACPVTFGVAGRNAVHWGAFDSDHNTNNWRRTVFDTQSTLRGERPGGHSHFDRLCNQSHSIYFSSRDSIYPGCHRFRLCRFCSGSSWWVYLDLSGPGRFTGGPLSIPPLDRSYFQLYLAWNYSVTNGGFWCRYCASILFYSDGRCPGDYGVSRKA